LIERSEHMDLMEANKKRHHENLPLYRKRQAIVEHPFGVIKRQWDFYYIMTKKSIKHAQADVGMIFTAYNLRRIFNLIDKKLLQKYLKELGLTVFELKRLLKGILRLFKTPEFSIELNPVS
jgi:ABC-type arginine transport system ATPase subunit